MQLSQLIILQPSYCAIGRALSSYEVWKDFILPILIALFAGYMVYWAFIRETKRDKDKELAAEEQTRRDKLVYFANLVKNIVSFSEQMNVNILDFIMEQRADPSEVKRLLLFSLNEYRRLTTDLSLESYMLAYVNHYRGDRQAVIREFNNILIRIDLLHSNYKMMEPHLELVREDRAEDSRQFRNCQLRTSNLLVSLTGRLKLSAPGLAEELDQIAFALMRKGLRLDTATFYHDFFVPLNSFARKYMGTALAETPMIQELAMLTRDGGILYEHMMKQSEGLVDDFQRQYDQLDREVEKLKKFSKTLLEDFGR